MIVGAYNFKYGDGNSGVKAVTMKRKRAAEKRMLRVLAFSDMHGNEKALRALAKKAGKADIIICAGDFTVFENNILRIMRKLDSIGKPLMLVHGNHEDAMFVAEICKRLKNVKFVHKKVYSSNKGTAAPLSTLRSEKLSDYAFVGHGGEGFDAVSEDFERFAKSAIPKLQQLRKNGKKIIFVTHQPPHNTKLDYVWAHHGNKSYTKFLKKIQPLLHVCGHLHETQGKKDKIGATKIINPGPKGKMVEV